MRNWKRSLEVLYVVDGVRFKMPKFADESHTPLCHCMVRVVEESPNIVHCNPFDEEPRYVFPHHFIGNPIGQEHYMSVAWLRHKRDQGQGKATVECEDVPVIRCYLFTGRYAGEWERAHVQVCKFTTTLGEEYLLLIYSPTEAPEQYEVKLKLHADKTGLYDPEFDLQVDGVRSYVRLKPVKPREPQPNPVETSTLLD